MQLRYQPSRILACISCRSQQLSLGSCSTVCRVPQIGPCSPSHTHRLRAAVEAAFCHTRGPIEHHCIHCSREAACVWRCCSTCSTEAINIAGAGHDQARGIPNALVHLLTINTLTPLPFEATTRPIDAPVKFTGSPPGNRRCPQKRCAADHFAMYNKKQKPEPQETLHRVQTQLRRTQLTTTVKSKAP
jgi:hypothetical protein